MKEIVGGSFTGFTSYSKNVLAEPPSVSVTEIVMKAVPNPLVKGRRVTVRFAPLPPKVIPPLEINSPLDDCAANCRLAAGVSTSPMVKGTVTTVSSLTTWSGMDEMVGKSLTERTVTVKVRVTRLLEVPPSLTVTETVAMPLALVTVLKLKEPPGEGLEEENVRLVSSAGLLLLAVRVRV